mmetsp:Transcript_53833/g.125843  ORF Transcript_53833/g.125843 Transcript_53833/m.125843 type:complete len:193 (+) Transcript_53833:49-627(+)
MRVQSPQQMASQWWSSRLRSRAALLRMRALASLLAVLLATFSDVSATFTMRCSYEHAPGRGATSVRRHGMGEDWPAPERIEADDEVSEDQMVLTEENVLLAIEDMKIVLGNVFGYDPESARAGITGGVGLDGVEGPIVVISFTGEFWHRRVDVLQRCENYLLRRIPEIAEVQISDPEMLVDNSDKGIYHYKN